MSRRRRHLYFTPNPLLPPARSKKMLQADAAHARRRLEEERVRLDAESKRLDAEEQRLLELEEEIEDLDS